MARLHHVQLHDKCHQGLSPCSPPPLYTPMHVTWYHLTLALEKIMKLINLKLEGSILLHKPNQHEDLLVKGTQCTLQFISCTGPNFNQPGQAVQSKYRLYMIQHGTVRQMNDPLLVKYIWGVM